MTQQQQQHSMELSYGKQSVPVFKILKEGAGGGAMGVVVAVAFVRIGPSGTELYWWWTSAAAGAARPARR